MKMDKELIRKLLNHVECYADGVSPLALPTIEDYSPKVVQYHLGLCKEAGFVRVSSTKRDVVFGLTYQGHLELDKLRGERN